MRSFDFSSWQSVLTTLVGLALFTLISIGIRLLMMFTVQQRRERMNRQINERLRTLIAAYKTLGGSFTGNLGVDPTHLGDIRKREKTADESETTLDLKLDATGYEGSDRQRRIRDAVEAALSDIILLGTEQQVRLATQAVGELVAGRTVHIHELVVSLRDFIRDALDLAPIASDLVLPKQGPARPSSSGRNGGKGERANEGSRGSGGGGAGGGAGGSGPGMGMADDQPSSDHR